MIGFVLKFTRGSLPLVDKLLLSSGMIGLFFVMFSTVELDFLTPWGRSIATNGGGIIDACRDSFFSLGDSGLFDVIICSINSSVLLFILFSTIVSN